MNPTDRRQLASLAYPGGGAALDEYVTARLDAGDSYKQIAEDVSAKMGVGVAVSREWVRRWYPKAAA